jgi:ADP-ribose pyrophosphatase
MYSSNPMKNRTIKPEKGVQKVTLLNVEKCGEARENPYLSLHRLSLENRYSDGTRSERYAYDAVLRKWLDAVVIVLLCRIDNRMHVCLRNSIRPPLLIRHHCAVPLPEQNEIWSLWELPAGLLEPEDVGESGIVQRAKIEILEETGYVVAADAIRRMKGAPFISAGTIPERLWYVVAEVADVLDRVDAVGDGCPIEENAEIQWVELERALALCDDGAIEDLKTELGIRRIASSLRLNGEKHE